MMGFFLSTKVDEFFNGSNFEDKIKKINALSTHYSMTKHSFAPKEIF